MRSILSIGLFGVLLLAGSIIPSMAQELTFADHVVINEVDINPPGNDAHSVSEWVELYNPTANELDIGGWEIASTTVLKKTMTIPHGTTIPANGFLTYSYQTVWFTDVSETVQLRDSNGVVIDQTPSISDLGNDFNSWQRVYDGLDSDSASDWELDFSHAGSTNGRFIAETEDDVTTITTSIDKPGYLFGETAIISGEVSEQLFIEKPFFQAVQIKINIFGPNGYEKNINLHPDLYLKYSTSISLQKVLGINEGAYYVTVQYGDALASTQFTVGNEIIFTEEEIDTELNISTDKNSYIPGETAIIIANSNEVIPYEGMQFTVTNPDGQQIFDGTLYPNPEGEFSVSIFMDTVGPVYGFHQIVSEYGEHSAVSSFELVEDFKEDKPISLHTDKKAYALGETVYITGRLNNLWVFALDFEIQQTGLGALDTNVLDRIKILDSVKLEGDSTFSYEFQIANNPDRYGDYKVTASKNVGTETIFFHVVENPDEFVASDIPFTVLTDKLTYDVGDQITISGKVNDLQISSTYQTPTVDIRIKPVEGGTIFSNVHKPSGNSPDTVLYTLTAIPDQVGNYKVEDTLQYAIYLPGTYEVRASYADGLYYDSQFFTIIDPLDIETMIASTDKEVYGLAEDLQLTGLVPQGGAGNPSITITITKPDGDTDKFGTNVDEGKFSWSWTTPIFEKPQTIQNERSLFSSNYGIYKISINHEQNAPIVVFFKVSPNPDEDSLNLQPLTVTTEFPIYNAGDKLKVLGTSLKRVQGTQGLVVPDRVEVSVKSPSHKLIYESSVFSDSGGNFESIFDMPITIFEEGTYKVTALYQGIRAENFFQVDNDYFITESDELSLLIVTDKEEYNPGDTASITSRPSKMIFVEAIDVGIPTEEQTKLNCGSFVCGIGVPTSTLIQDQFGTFFYEYTFPDDISQGTHIITFSTEFGTFTKPIQIVEKIPEPEIQSTSSFTERVIEKVNRITESEVQISVNEKTIQGKESLPRVIQGSLFTPVRGDESIVNLKITTNEGTCIIGPETECLVKESTRGPGEIYKTVQIDEMNYKIRYSGSDVMLEKFTILPDASDIPLPDSIWNVQVIKNEQPSRLYYKITYNTEPAGFNVPAIIPLHAGYYDGEFVYYIITDSSEKIHADVISENQGWKVELAPLLANTPSEALSKTYIFTNGLTGDGIHGFQNEVFTNTPNSQEYSALTSHVHVSWSGAEVPTVLVSEKDILDAEKEGSVTLTELPVVINMPQILWPGGQMPVKADKTLSNETPYGGGQVLDINLDDMTVTFIAHKGWGPDGKEIYYIVTDATPTGPAEMMGVVYAPTSANLIANSAAVDLFQFSNGIEGPGPFGFQAGVSASSNGDLNYSPMWRIYQVSWVEDENASVLKTINDINTNKDEGLLEIAIAKPMGADHIVNCPFIDPFQ